MTYDINCSSCCVGKPLAAKHLTLTRAELLINYSPWHSVLGSTLSLPARFHRKMFILYLLLSSSSAKFAQKWASTKNILQSCRTTTLCITIEVAVKKNKKRFSPSLAVRLICQSLFVNTLYNDQPLSSMFNVHVLHVLLATCVSLCHPSKQLS